MHRLSGHHAAALSLSHIVRNGIREELESGSFDPTASRVAFLTGSRCGYRDKKAIFKPANGLA